MRTHDQRRPRTRFGALTLTAALAAAVAVPAVSVPADAAIDATGWWYPALDIADAHAAGWTGEGVNIAVIEPQINPEAPALAGANITTHEDFVCDGDVGVTSEISDDSLHGGDVVQMLVRPFGLDGDTGGIAPDAPIEVYVFGSIGCGFSPAADEPSTMGKAIIAAVDGGSDIISISQGMSAGPGDAAAVAYALAHDALIVSSSPNGSEDEGLTFPVGANGVVSVAAVSETLDLIADEATGEPVVTPEITVVAPGINIGTVGSNDDWAGLSVGSGSSTAAPLVAGSLALAKQKYPEATSNQLIQALIATTASAQNDLGRDTVNGYGYGLISLPGLLSSDPMSYPDENPLMDKESGAPSQAEVDAVNDPQPTADPESEQGETSTPTTSAEAQEEPSTDGQENEGPGALPWIIGGGIMLLGVAVVVFSVMRFRRDAGRS